MGSEMCIRDRALATYRMYHLKNTNPKYKMVSAPDAVMYTYDHSNTPYSNFTFDSSTGTFKLNYPTNASGTFYSYYGGSKSLIVEYTRFTSGASRLPQAMKVYKAESVSPSYVKGSYIMDVTAEKGTYPSSGSRGDYWYEYVGLSNRAPVITGSTTCLLYTSPSPRDS